MRISELTEEQRPQWDAYVRNAAAGLPQHLSGWRDVLQRTYQYETHFLMAIEVGADGDERIVGVAPVFNVASRLVGDTVSTMPGGICADSPEVAQALIERGREIAGRTRAKRFLIQDTRQQWPGSLQTTNHHEEWWVTLAADEEAMSKRLHRNIRRQIRMARRNGLTVEIDRTGALAGEFHQVLSRFTHQAGTPVFGRDFLENVIDVFPGGFNIVVVRNEETPIGAYFQLEMGDAIYGMWGAALHETLKLRPVYLAYWEIMVDALTHGFTFLDMGRSPVDSNASKFKAQWGGESRPIYQQVAGLTGGQAAASVADSVQSDARFLSFRKIWPKVPLPIATFLGPRLRRHVPFA
jgi:FemAB-related protein (PEP-CTERM system-associated)